MAFLRRSAKSATSTQDPTQARVTSRLLATALEDLGERTERFTVLDLGSGAGGTVAYFSDLDCPTHLVFADCHALGEELTQLSQTGEPPSFAEIVSTCQTHFSLAPDLELDLVLLWDFLHYFDLATVEAISSVLQPHIHPRTRGYGFGTLHNDQGIKAYDYAIASEGEVFMRPLANTLPFGHSQQALGENFICMRIGRGTLLQEGHLELLLEP